MREECEADDDCLKNCCVSPYFAPLFFVVFVLMAQFVLVNVVVVATPGPAPLVEGSIDSLVLRLEGGGGGGDARVCHAHIQIRHFEEPPPSFLPDEPIALSLALSTGLARRASLPPLSDIRYPFSNIRNRRIE